ncbi:MAG: restriction modification system DNA specificity domain-containing protein [Nitrospirales bacterium]|nr:MAG: restriction modification system DNA specificity domain-containing protein [Nitrospirales bacterium]
MNFKLRPYSAYKNSGVPWLGKVPKHWEVRKLRGILRRVTERNRPDLPLLSVVRERGVIRRDITNEAENHNYIPDDLTNYKVVQVGQFAMNKMKAWQGSYGVSQFKGIVSPAYYVFNLSGVDGRFFHSAIRSRAYVPSFTQASDGVRTGQWDLAEARMREIGFAIPSLSEQTAIVRFLDHYDRKIRRYIRAKQKLIKLLEEQKQAIIHRAVTRGLDPNVRLKPSGVDWLGDIPEHWEVRRLKEVTTPIEQGWSPQCDAWSAAEHEWGVLKVGCVNGDKFDEGQNKKLPSTLTPIPELEVQDGDILVSRANTRELLGLATLVVNPRQRLMLCDKLFRFRVKSKRIDPQFLVYAIRQKTSRAQIESSTNGASDSMQNIGQDVVRNLWLSLPSLDEQRKILVRLEVQTSAIVTTIAQAHQEISLLREYRTRLIADVVTGKLDVREAAANLPEDAEKDNISEEFEEPIEEREEAIDSELETSLGD